MDLVFSPKFKKAYNSANREIQKAFDKQLVHLLSDIKYPSLHAKKFDEATGLWQARVTRSWRLYFTIEGNIYYLVNLRDHPK